MELVTIGFWEILLDMAALTLCGITVLYIVGKKKVQYPRSIPNTSDERIQSIVQKTFYHLIHQHPGHSFNRLIETVTKEQAVRQPSGVGKVSSGTKLKTAAGGLKNQESKRLKAPNPMKTETRDTKSMRIYQFTASGMSVKKISEKLEMPRCEVELIAKFQQRGNRQTALQ